MKVALAHDSLTQYGGAERVLEALHELYPDAPVFTLVFDKKLSDRFEGWQIISSPLQYFYDFLPKLQYWLPFIPIALRFFDFSKFDVVISSSSVFMKGIRVPKEILHINYCHTPARFLWLEMDQYISEELPLRMRPFKFLLKAYLKWMRGWDYRAAQRVSFFIANSKNVQERIQKFYQRESNVIYPFADLDFFYPVQPKENFYLVVSRLQHHKRIDLVCKVFAKRKIALHVIGTGRAEKHLKNISAENIVFLGSVDNEILRNEYSKAIALIHPQEEDFGITAVEAMASGTPVIAYGKGGALETVVAGKTGLFFNEQTEQSLEAALNTFEQMHFESEDLFAQAEKFSKQKFIADIAEFVNSKI